MNQSAISPKREADRTTKAVKVVTIAVCTVTTAVMCANLVAISHGSNHAGSAHQVKLIYVGHAPKTAHA